MQALNSGSVEKMKAMCSLKKQNQIVIDPQYNEMIQKVYMMCENCSSKVFVNVEKLIGQKKYLSQHISSHYDSQHKNRPNWEFYCVKKEFSTNIFWAEFSRNLRCMKRFIRSYPP